MKRLLALALTVLTLCSAIISPNAQAAAGDSTTIEQVVSSLGIMSGDQNGNMNLSSSVTRAQFAKMLVAASTLKDSVAATGNASPFRDVPYTHWAANYIKTAVNQGWVTGYLDGTFRPENPVTLAEATTAVLKLLGYASTDFSGSFPAAQMALLQSTGLGDGISGSATTTMTRANAMRMFYNLLSVKTKDGNSKYMQALGYSLDSDGNPDYNSLLQATMSGPVVYTSSSLSSTLGFTPTTVYRNGALSSVSALQTYDVLYYSAARKTVWSYARRVTGIYQSATPSKDNPTSVVIAGTTYSVTSSTALYQLSTQGGLPIGSNITVLLGKNGDVVAAYSAESLTTELVGLVTNRGTGTYTNANGSTYTAVSITLTATDGQSYTIPLDNVSSSITAGSLVRVSYTASGTTINTLTRASLSGKVTTTTLAGKTAAANINILDVTDTVASTVYMARINGLTLTTSNVLYYALNAAGEVDTLILNNVTGDAYTYGIVLTAKESTDDFNASGSYTFLINGQKSSLTTANSSLGASTGPARFIMNGTQVSSLQSLTEVKGITSITDLYVKNATETHSIWDYAAVYVYKDNTYTQMDRTELSVTAYSIRAYYDKTDASGGRIRIIIATPLAS